MNTVTINKIQRISNGVPAAQTRAKPNAALKTLSYPPPIQEKLDHLKQVIQSGTPSIQLTKVKIKNTRLNKEYEGESGSSAETDMRSTTHGNLVADRLKAIPCAYSMGTADQFTCAEPHALAKFVNDTTKTKLNDDMTKAKVGNAMDGSTFKEPCDRICSKWVWGKKDAYYITNVIPKKTELNAL